MNHTAQRFWGGGIKPLIVKKGNRGFIDLHGFHAQDALERFLDYYNQRVKRGDKNVIEVLHGYGSHGRGGDAIKKRIRAFLKRFPDYVNFERGTTEGRMYDDLTLVYPKRILPDLENQLVAEILEFCSSKKSEEKIFNKFRRHGDKKVREVLIGLVKDGRLEIKREKFKFYLQK
jgi:hypothetical protein